MDIFEFENSVWGSDLWTDEAINKCRKSEPNESTGTPIDSTLDLQYMLWRGCRFGNMDWIQ